MTPMQQFNELIELADWVTGYRYDRLSIHELVDHLTNFPRLAGEIVRLAIELGLWRHN